MSKVLFNFHSNVTSTSYILTGYKSTPLLLSNNRLGKGIFTNTNCTNIRLQLDKDGYVSISGLLSEKQLRLKETPYTQGDYRNTWSWHIEDIDKECPKGIPYLLYLLNNNTSPLKNWDKDEDELKISCYMFNNFLTYFLPLIGLENQVREANGNKILKTFAFIGKEYINKITLGNCYYNRDGKAISYIEPPLGEFGNDINNVDAFNITHKSTALLLATVTTSAAPTVSTTATGTATTTTATAVAGTTTTVVTPTPEIEAEDNNEVVDNGETVTINTQQIGGTSTTTSAYRVPVVITYKDFIKVISDKITSKINKFLEDFGGWKIDARMLATLINMAKGNFWIDKYHDEQEEFKKIFEWTPRKLVENQLLCLYLCRPGVVDTFDSNEMESKFTSPEFDEIFEALEKCPTKINYGGYVIDIFKMINTQLTIFLGTPSAGKTYTTQKVFKGIPQVCCNSGMQSDEIMQTFSMATIRNSAGEIISTYPIYTPSIINLCMSSGNPVLMDEIHLLMPDTMNGLQPFTDGCKKKVLTHQDGTGEDNVNNYIDLKEGGMIIGTGNLDNNGSPTKFPEAILSRTVFLLKKDTSIETTAKFASGIIVEDNQDIEVLDENGNPLDIKKYLENNEEESKESY